MSVIAKTAQVRRAALLLAAAFAATGCREHARLDDFTARELSNPETRHAIGYTSKAAALYVEVPNGADGLSPNQAQDVRQFLARYKSESDGRLRIEAPAGARGHLTASRSVRDVEALVAEAGVPRSAVETRRGAANRRDAAVKLAFDRPVAVGPPCGDWPEDLGHNRERLPHPDFGCSSQRNLAVMVANSRDLQEPQPEAPRSSEVRSKHWSSYAGSSSSGGGSGGGTSAPAPAKPAGDGGSPATKQ